MNKLLSALMLIFLTVLPAESGMITVPVTLTYQGRTVHATMAVDTGATTTTIGTALADRLGIPLNTGRTGMAEMADGRAVFYTAAVMDVTAGDMARADITVNIMEYAGSRAVDGWLGMNFLSHKTLTFDWRNRRIYWSE